MTNKEKEFLERLQAMFLIEAEEHLSAMSSGLLELEKNPEAENTLEIIETVFRSAHSLKGAARSVSRIDIESVCQILEDIFSKLKNKTLELSSSNFDIIHQTIDEITKMMENKNSGKEEKPKNMIPELKKIAKPPENDQSKVDISFEVKVDNPKQIISTNQEKIESPPPKNDDIEIKVSEIQVEEKTPVDRSHRQSKGKPFHIDTVRIQTSKLDPIFREAEQMIQSKISYAQRFSDLNLIHQEIIHWKSELRKLENQQIACEDSIYKEFINWNSERINEIEQGIFKLTRAFENDLRSHSRMLDEHLESTKKVLMHPVSIIVEAFPKMIRDLARAQKKEVDLIIDGTEIEVDKRILEELKDPLIHILRNAIDHGIGKPAERLKLNKPEKGKIKLHFSVKDGRNLEINITDDGVGIDIEKVKKAAIKSKLVKAETAHQMSDEDIKALIFNTGFSTSTMITDISGRGLGMAIVREKVEKLNGKLSVQSVDRQGTNIQIIVPLTLSTFRGVLVKAGENDFFIPTINVDYVLRLTKEEVKTVENRETILVDNEIIGVVKLCDVLGIKEKANDIEEYIQIVVISQAGNSIGFKVNEVFDEHQILVKDLGKQLKRVNNISGASVLGSGKVVPVINVSDLMKSALNVGKSSIFSTVEEQSDAEKTSKILVTDDSITSRTLIKNILETYGYHVSTAIDGLDAFTKALIGEFDLIVSDVDMPRMSGFELTAKVRKEKKISETPVILVTALETREDREHGIDVGANAYIVKSSFDQSNLIEVVQRLL